MPFVIENAPESQFQDWYKGQASKLGLNPNPDDPEHHYDYRAAYQAGAKPDESGHWPSQFKTEGHPRRFILETEPTEQTPSPPKEQEPSTFQKFAVPVHRGLEAIGALPEGSPIKNIQKSFADQPAEEERLAEKFRPVFGEGARALARPLSAANAAFGALSAVTPKGINEGLSRATEGITALVKPMIRQAL